MQTLNIISDKGYCNQPVVITCNKNYIFVYRTDVARVWSEDRTKPFSRSKFLTANLIFNHAPRTFTGPKYFPCAGPYRLRTVFLIARTTLDADRDGWSDCGSGFVILLMLKLAHSDALKIKKFCLYFHIFIYVHIYTTSLWLDI